jgi:Protein of unknown function (DUF2934)
MQKGVDMFKKTTIEPQEKLNTAAPAAPRLAPETRPSAAPKADVTREAIAKLAFQKWQKRGSPIGEDQRDWFEAERELKASPTPRAAR